MSTLAEAHAVTYPLALEHRDRPDFRLTLAGVVIGIEFTEAIPVNWSWALAKRNENGYSNLISLEKFVAGEPLRPSEEIEAIARGDRCGDGWVGDTPEQQWVEAMLHFANVKARKLTAAGFSTYNQNWLLIYDNWPVPGLNEEVAAAHLAPRLRAAALPFSRVFVECTSSIVDFADTCWTIHTINDLWLNR